MGQFFYKAKQGPSQIVEGIIEADHEEMAVSRILKMGYTPLNVQAAPAASAVNRGPGEGGAAPPGLRVRTQDIMIFTRQMSDLISAGVPVLRALYLVNKQVKNKRLQTVIGQMVAVVEDGGALSSALARFPGVFSPFYINIVRSGEVGGKLDGVLARLADYVEKDYDIQSQVRTSLMYPGLILFVGGVTIFVILTWVIPKISTIFIDMNESLPLVTTALLAVSHFLARFWWALLAVFALVAMLLRRACATPEGKRGIDSLKLKIPVIGPFIQEVEIGRFARTLGTLLSNGVTVVTAIDTVCQVIDNELFKQDALKMHHRLTGGGSLTQAMQSCAFFPEAAVNMVVVGEETGQLHQGLLKLASYYEHQSERTMKRVASLIEPVLILVMGVFIGFIVLGMLLPIFRMNLIIK
ncbi:MAG TPA: type II secretion system F family protein [Candidatus Omnitrophota bacterium]|nr:type II secretion system F family protein [Candidatus Omnitrophota bacterium]HQO59106.1 type II secretion system F family protein [Candidatus Omnitrophota bacterium]